MEPNGIEYVFAVYGLVLATLVLWVWMLGRRVARLRVLDERQAPRETTGA